MLDTTILKENEVFPMFCSNCGTALNNGERFCPECGTPVAQPQQGFSPEPEPTGSEQPAFTPGPAYVPVYSPEPAPKKSRKALWISLCCIALAVIAAVVLLLVLQPWNKCTPKTPEQIVRTSFQQTMQAESVHEDMTTLISLEMQVSGISMNMDVTTEAHADMQTDPLVLRMEASTSMLGISQQYLAYMETVGDEVRLYISSDDGKTWQRSAELPVSIPGLNEKGFGLPEQWDLKDLSETGTEDVNGSPATVYSGFLPKEMFTENNALTEDLPMSLPMDMQNILDRIEDIPATLWVDKATGRLVRYRMDLAAALRIILDYVMETQGDELSGLTYSVRNATVDCTFSQFNEIPPIEIPDAAKRN